MFIEDWLLLFPIFAVDALDFRRGELARGLAVVSRLILCRVPVAAAAGVRFGRRFDCYLDNVLEVAMWIIGAGDKCDDVRDICVLRQVTHDSRDAALQA